VRGIIGLNDMRIVGIRLGLARDRPQELANRIDLDLFLMFENLEKARPNR
jgi:hypothetical protein